MRYLALTEEKVAALDWEQNSEGNRLIQQAFSPRIPLIA